MTLKKISKFFEAIYSTVHSWSRGGDGNRQSVSYELICENAKMPLKIN